MKRWLGLAGLAVFLTSSVALANGRYPQSGEIVVDSENPDRLVVWTTYGVIVTSDHGGHWDWICEPSVGYPTADAANPYFGITHGGTIIGGLFQGLTLSNDSGCSFHFYPPLQGDYIVDLAVDKNDPTKAVLVRSNGITVTEYTTQVWETQDSAMSWSEAGVDLPTDTVALTVDTAPSDPMRTYVSARIGPPSFAGVIERSDDRGANWQRFTVPGSDNDHLPYIGAVDPNNADVFYVRLDSMHADSITATADGGMSWNTIFTGQGNLGGFAISPDGSEIAVCGDQDGVLVASTSDMHFTKKSDVPCYCLTWTAAGIYACGKEATAGFEVGLSIDDGKTFAGLEHLPEICGPKACPADSSTSVDCPDVWSLTKVTIGASCDGGGGAGGANATSSAGTGGAGGSSSSSSSGCSWATDGTPGDGRFALAAAMAAMLFASRRRQPSRR